METTHSTVTSVPECRLIKSFGDGHNHEYEQYQEIAEIVKSFGSRMQGVLLGNVYCGCVSLDSLLLTPFGVFIIEFKSYSVARIRITGQKDFQCLDSSGERIRTETGAFLDVKGGSSPSPYEQARINRREVKNVLGDVFAQNVNVKVVIVFKDDVEIDGLDTLGDDRKWLSVISTSKFKSYLEDASRKGGMGLQDSERKVLIGKIEAVGDVQEKVDVWKLAQKSYEVGKLSDAYQKLRKCDPLRAEVRLLTLQVLYELKKTTEFSDLAIEEQCSRDEQISGKARELIGRSLANGTNGFKKNIELAIECLEKIENPNPSVKEYLTKIKEEKSRSEQWERDYRFENWGREARKSLLDGALAGYKTTGRIAATFTLLAAIIFSVTVLAPIKAYMWSYYGAASTVVIIAAILYFFYEQDSIDYWFVKKTAPEHFYDLDFMTVKVNDLDWSDGNRLWKSVLSMLGLIIFKMALFVPCYLVARKFFLLFTATKTGMLAQSFLFFQCGVRDFSWLFVFVLFYFIVNFLAYVVAAFWQIKNEYRCYDDGHSNRMILAVVPKLFSDNGMPSLLGDLKLCWESFKYGVSLFLLLCVLGYAKPYLYALLTFVFT